MRPNTYYCATCDMEGIGSLDDHWDVKHFDEIRPWGDKSPKKSETCGKCGVKLRGADALDLDTLVSRHYAEEHTPINPGRKDDQEKLRFDLIPAEVETALAAVLTYGAKRYSDRNWEKGLDWMRCYAAARRHLNAWLRGEDIDEESGLPAIDLALCEIVFLSTFYHRKSSHDFDNRPVQ